MVKSDFRPAVRVRGRPEGVARAYCRKHTFDISAPLGVGDEEAAPAGVDYLLGALGGELLTGFAREAERRGIELSGLEATVQGRLNNPLRAVGVIGESGHPGFEAIEATLYVGAMADADALDDIWRTALDRAPLVHTLERCVSLSLELSVL